MAKNPRKFRVSDPYGNTIRVEAYKLERGKWVPEVRVMDLDERWVWSAAEHTEIDPLIADLITAREHAFGPWSRDTGVNSVPAASGDRALLLALVRSLKEVTSSRAEYARCEAAIKMLGG